MIPNFIFIIPYRNRIQHKYFFDTYIKKVLEDISSNEYEIYYSEQCDNLSFNRGAMKNIGFLAMKNKYPEHYKNITFVFNDVDCMPYKKNIITYPTKINTIKHFYGFEHVLGGIVSVTGYDFEKMNGFPNFWTWGYEDNLLYDRALEKKINVDRNIFFKMNDSNILHFYHGNTRNHDIKLKPRNIYYKNNGITSIYNIDYKIENEMIKINSFKIYNDRKPQKIESIDITNIQYLNQKKYINDRCKNPRFRMGI